ncbi:MAG: hypothetical protein Q4B02_10605 [Propionibacteriaceae bacterium]|jgi:hypothetical protein|nr:hypothetical protein [Propionibacteriaceae bacterium]
MTSDSLRAARHDGGGDRFLALFLTLSVEGRNLPQRAGERRLRGLVTEFFAQPAVHDALGHADTALDDELADAATTYFQTCLNDSQYTSRLLGLTRLSSQEVRDKIARDFAAMAAAVVASGALSGDGARLLPALLNGLRRALRDGADELARDAIAVNHLATQASGLLWSE